MTRSVRHGIRVLTWNIHKGVGGMDRRFDFERVVEVLRHYEADVMLLQEVAQGIPRLHRTDQAELLAAEFSPFHCEFHPEHQFRVGGYGNMIISRWPLEDVQHVDLTIRWRKRRGGLLASVKGPGLRRRGLAVANLHLGLAGSERSEQLERFLQADCVGRLPSAAPIVVGGDLNDLWGSLGPKHFHGRGFHRAGTLVRTFPSALPLRPLDAIFYRGPIGSLRCFAARAQLARAASDHIPLVADFQIGH